MSYDLSLFRVPEGADALQVYRQMAARCELDGVNLDEWLKRPVPASVRAEMRRIADLLKVWRPALQEFVPKSPLPWIELTDEDLAIQFGVSDGQVSVTMAYFGDRGPEVMACIASCLDTLKGQGYSAYDPQLEQIVSPANLREMTAEYQRVDNLLPAILGQLDAARPGKKAWWKFW